MLKSKLENILSNLFSPEQLLLLKLIPSLDTTFNLDNFNTKFLNKLQTDKKDITFIIENNELFIILGKVNNLCMNGKIQYNTYNLSTNGTPYIKQFSNKILHNNDSYSETNYTTYKDVNSNLMFESSPTYGINNCDCCEDKPNSKYQNKCSLCNSGKFTLDYTCPHSYICVSANIPYNPNTQPNSYEQTLRAMCPISLSNCDCCTRVPPQSIDATSCAYCPDASYSSDATNCLTGYRCIPASSTKSCPKTSLGSPTIIYYNVSANVPDPTANVKIRPIFDRADIIIDFDTGKDAGLPIARWNGTGTNNLVPQPSSKNAKNLRGVKLGVNVGGGGATDKGVLVGGFIHPDFLKGNRPNSVDSKTLTTLKTNGYDIICFDIEMLGDQLKPDSNMGGYETDDYGWDWNTPSNINDNTTFDSNAKAVYNVYSIAFKTIKALLLPNGKPAGLKILVTTGGNGNTQQMGYAFPYPTGPTGSKPPQQTIQQYKEKQTVALLKYFASDSTIDFYNPQAYDADVKFNSIIGYGQAPQYCDWNATLITPILPSNYVDAHNGWDGDPKSSDFGWTDGDKTVNASCFNINKYAVYPNLEAPT